MLTEISGTPFLERMSGVFPGNPLNGTSVPFIPPSAWATTRPYSCPLMGLIVQTEHLSPWTDLRLLLNLTPPADLTESDYQYYGSLPQPRMPWPIFSRFATQGTLQNIATFFTGKWDHFGDRAKPVKGENAVYHVNLFGVVESGTSDSRLLRRDYSAEEESPKTAIVVTGSSPYVLSQAGDVLPMPTGPLTSALENIQTTVNSGGYYFPAPTGIERYYRNFVISSDALGSVSFGWEYVVRNQEPSGRIYINHFCIKTTVDWMFNPYAITLGHVVHCDNFSSLVVNTMWHYVHGIWADPGTPLHMSIPQYIAAYGDDAPLFHEWDAATAQTYGVEEVGATSLATRSVVKQLPDLIGYSKAQKRYDSQNSGTFKHFERAVIPAIGEALPLAFFSSQNALEKQFSYMESNHVEALAELSSVLDPLDLIKLGKVLPDYVGKKGVLLIKMLDLLTDAVLVYNLGIAPTYGDAKDVADKASVFRNRVLSGQALMAQTTNGKYTIPVPDELSAGYTDLVMVVRSKIRVKPIHDTLLANVLPVDALGLLPSFSTAWDLFPLSFVIDWLTNTGDSLDIVETTAKFMALKIEYCVHSFTIARRFTPQEEVDFSFSQVGESGAGYRHYIRIVSREMPIFAPTAYPVISPAVGNYSVAGSLLWKFIQ